MNGYGQPPGLGEYFEPEQIDRFVRRSGVDSDLIVRTLGGCLTTGEPPVRAKASFLLKGFGGRAAPAKSFLISAVDDPVDNVRFGAIETVSRIGLPAEEIASILISKLRDSSAMVRQAAEVDLADLFEVATPFTDRARNVTRRTNTRTASALPVLVGSVLDPDVEVRRGVAHCLFRLGPQAAPTTPNLIAALEDPDVVVRLWSAKAIALLKPENRKAVDILKEELPRIMADLPARNYAETAIEAREVLLRLGPAAVPALIRSVKDQKKSVTVQSPSRPRACLKRPDSRSAPCNCWPPQYCLCR